MIQLIFIQYVHFGLVHITFTWWLIRCKKLNVLFLNSSELKKKIKQELSEVLFKMCNFIYMLFGA